MLTVAHKCYSEPPFLLATIFEVGVVMVISDSCKLWAALATVWATGAGGALDTRPSHLRYHGIVHPGLGLAFAVASSILLLDEGRKLMLRLLQRNFQKPTN